jgi:hypothetical protein
MSKNIGLIVGRASRSEHGMTLRAVCAKCGEQIETKPFYVDGEGAAQWRHSKTLYAWCHVTKAQPRISSKLEPVCGDLL